MNYTKEMYDAGELPKIGMKGRFFASSKFGGADFVDGVCLSVAKISNDRFAIMFEYENGYNIPIDCTLFEAAWVKPIDTRTDREQAIDDLNYVLMNEVAGKTTKQIAEHIIDKCIGQQFEYLTFAGDEQ